MEDMMGGSNIPGDASVDPGMPHLLELARVALINLLDDGDEADRSDALALVERLRDASSRLSTGAVHDAMKRAADRPMTAEEIARQKESWIRGQVGPEMEGTAVVTSDIARQRREDAHDGGEDIPDNVMEAYFAWAEKARDPERSRLATRAADEISGGTEFTGEWFAYFRAFVAGAKAERARVVDWHTRRADKLELEAKGAPSEEAARGVLLVAVLHRECARFLNDRPFPTPEGRTHG